MELPAGWRRLEAVGCNYLACHTGRIPAADSGPGGDAVPVTVQGLDILSRPVEIRTAGFPLGSASSSSIIAVEYQSHNVMQGISGLFVVDVGSTQLSGFAARRMDLTHRRAGVALFTRRWVMPAGQRTLEIAATCPLDHFRRHIQDFDELEDRIQVAA
ncbi:hypothetical protein JTF08_01585 [Micrococcaceae bacterium RIT802]|nr:hypothetical protein [Micrococcaceae bacterium RIT 802]